MSSKIDISNSEEKIDRLSSRNKSSSSGKDGFYVKKSIVFFLAIFIPILFVGSILATYFGKPDNATQTIISNSIYLLVFLKDSKNTKSNLT